MMNIEKNLAQTDLNQFKTEPLKLLAKQLYKHQDYKFSIVINRINRLNFKDSTIYEYYRKIRQYLTDGTKHKGYDALYRYVNEFKESGLTPLRPSEKEAIKKYTRSGKQLKTPTEPPKYIEKVPPQYGVMCENKIILQPSKEMALGYLECYKIIGDGKAVKLVTVDIEEIEV